MTSKVKTVLFASLIAAMILPFSTMDFAEAQKGEKYTPEDIKNAMQKADQYVTQNELIVTFDKTSAKATMSNQEIKIIKDFVKMQNDYVNKVKANPNIKHQFDSEINDKFSELKKQVKDSKKKNISDNITQWILPEAFAWTDVCGGSFDNPHVEYIKKTILTQSSQSTAVSTVTSWGYVSVAPYASNPLEWLNPNSLDYGREMSYYNCNFGAFRDQIVLEEDNGDWDFRKQIKEPNPSFLDYAQPVWWWIWYTGEWHHPGVGQSTSSW